MIQHSIRVVQLQLQGIIKEGMSLTQARSGSQGQEAFWLWARVLDSDVKLAPEAADGAMYDRQVWQRPSWPFTSV